MPGSSTLLLDRSGWDLVLDASGDIAVAAAPYSLAQDAASACKTFLAECYWDITIGVPYLTQVFGGTPPAPSTLKQLWTTAALTVPDVASAQCFIVQSTNRNLGGQVQVAPKSGGTPQAMNFSVANPQGSG